MKIQKSNINIWSFQNLIVTLHSLKKNDRGVEQLVARQAHNLEVACSSLASATNQKRNATQWIAFLFLVTIK